jgi:hypothetical protein
VNGVRRNNTPRGAVKKSDRCMTVRGSSVQTQDMLHHNKPRLPPDQHEQEKVFLF